MLSGITHVPELELSEDESKRMADATVTLARHYNFHATDKQMAWINLSMCAGSIYGSRFFVYSARMKEENKVKAQARQQATPPASAPSMPGMPDLMQAQAG